MFCCSLAQWCPEFTTRWTAACQASLSFAVSWSLLKFMSILSVMLSNHPVSPPSPLALSLSRSLSFPMSPIFASIGQSIGASASASILPVNIQGWFTLGLTGWSPCCPRFTLKILLYHHNPKASILWSTLFMDWLAHLYLLLEKQQLWH